MNEQVLGTLDPAFAEPVWTVRGSQAYRRINIALFLAGYATFSLIYCTQPLLPVFTADFRVSPAESSLALSLTTGLLAWSILAAGALSEGIGRKTLMFLSICAAAGLNLAAAAAPSWPLLLLARALEGVVLGGVPAVAMAYLAEEIDPRGLGLAMGLYVSGTALGGMLGRIVTGVVTDLGSWRLAMGAIGAIGLLAAQGFVLLLPPSRNFHRRRSLDPLFHLAAWRGHLRQPGLALLFLTGFLVMGTFVTVFNYIGFRLLAPPYNLGQSAVGMIFVIYLFGAVASSTAGALADRLGRGPVLIVSLLLSLTGIGLSLLSDLPWVIAGIGGVTIGFFASHAVASGWVGRLAHEAKGHAASLYLLGYYLGSSIMGSLGGWFWWHGGWPAVATFTAVMILAALAVAVALDRLARRAARI